MVQKDNSSDLLLLQGLHKGILQPIGVLRLQSLLLIGRHALLTEDSPILLLLPVGCEVGSALGAEERLHAGQGPSEFTYREDSASANSSVYSKSDNLKPK